MIRFTRIMNQLRFIGVTLVLAAVPAGCKQESAKSATDQSGTKSAPVSAAAPAKPEHSDTHNPRTSKNCIEADTDENGQTSDEEALAFYKSEFEENREKVKEHNSVMIQTYDANGDGRLEKSELGDYLRYRTALVSNIPGISKGCTMADTDENGQTSEEEAATYYKSQLDENRNKLAAHNRTMMERYDTDQNGRLEKNELRDYLDRRTLLLKKTGSADGK